MDNEHLKDDICGRLFAWYDEHKRDLPWRHTRDPYKIWISEVILQQTRVAQGYDYFVRFVERFPTVDALAMAPEDEVMCYWQGLGYYSRARNLHAAAKRIVELGNFPSTYSEIIHLKGIGEYTAAAIASFAFDEPQAAVDGNVCRVWARLFGIEEPIDSTKGKKIIGQIAQTLLPEKHAALYNQTIMEFGALQCIPHNPDCTVCPLVDKCVAWAQRKVDNLPVKAHKTKVSDRYFHYLFVHNANSLLLHKRSGKDIWNNLYELPLIETPTNASEEELYAMSAYRTWEQKGCFVHRGVPVKVKHVLSHQRIHTSFYELVTEDALPTPEDFVVVPFEALPQYALSQLVYTYLQKKKVF